MTEIVLTLEHKYDGGHEAGQVEEVEGTEDFQNLGKSGRYRCQYPHPIGELFELLVPILGAQFALENVFHSREFPGEGVLLSHIPL